LLLSILHLLRHQHGIRLFPQSIVRAASRLALGNFFALIDPALHTDQAVSGVGLGRSEVDISAQSLQRQTSLQVPLLAGDFRAIQPAGDAHLDSLASKAQRRIYSLAHGSPEGDALFELQRD